MEEIAGGEMRMLEHEFDSSTPRWFVRCLNGMRAAEIRRFDTDSWLARRVAYLTGQWKKGTREKDIWPLGAEINATKTELEEIRDMIEATWQPIGDA